MITNRYLIGAAVALAAVAGAWFHGHHHGKQSAELTTAQAWLDSAEAARKVQEKQQEAVNNAIKKQYREQVRVNSGLLADLERLRERPERPSLPETPRTECEGTTGAELSREDAGFLAREAARADTLRTGLVSCYATFDAMKEGP